MEHIISVADLIAALSKLKPDDLLYPNRVANLSIVRNDEFIGYIDLVINRSVEERVVLNDDGIEGD